MKISIKEQPCAIGRLHYAWVVLAGCCVMVFMSMGLSNNVSGQFIQAAGAELGIGKGTLSMYLTIQGWVQLLMVPVVARVARGKHQYPVMLVSACVFSLTYGLMGRFIHAWQWWAAGVMCGITLPFLSVLTVMLLINRWFRHSYSLAQAIAMACSGLAGAVLNPIVGLWIARFGWRQTYLFCGVMCGIIMLCSILFLIRVQPADKGLMPYGLHTDEALPDEPEFSAIPPGASFARIVRHPGFYTVLLIQMAIMFVASLNQHVPSIAVSMGLSQSVGVTGVTILMISIVVWRLLWGSLADRLGYKVVLLLSFGVCAVGIASMLLIRGATEISYYVGIILYTVGSSTSLTMGSIMVREVFGLYSYEKVYPCINMAGGFAAAISISAYGFLFDSSGSWDLSYQLMIAACLIIIAGAVVIRKPEWDEGQSKK